MGIPISDSDKKAYYSARYPHGTIVELTEAIEDNFTRSIPSGSRFEVDYVDDMCQLQGRWLPPQSGTLAIIIGHDQFRIVNEEDCEEKSVRKIMAYMLRCDENGVQYKGYLSEVKFSDGGVCEGDNADDMIDIFTLSDDIAVICKPEAVIQGRPLNRAVYDMDGKFVTILADNLMVVRLKNGELASISESDVEVIEKQLKPIEKISCGKIYLKSADSLPEWGKPHK